LPGEVLSGNYCLI